MPATEAVTFVFEGAIHRDSFIGFARHRAARLDLQLTLGDCRDDRIDLAIRGQGALIDAFEMACSLGPRDCLVRDVRRESTVDQAP